MNNGINGGAGLARLLSVDDVYLVPQQGVLTSRGDAVLHPFIYSAPMDTVTGYKMALAMRNANQFPCISRFISDDEYLACLQAYGTDPDVWFAVGGTKEGLLKFMRLLNSMEEPLPEDTQLSVIVDIAHGDSPTGTEAVSFLADRPFVGKVMTGSIANPKAAERLIEAGATHLRVGIGPGAACTTRVMTGIGVPQFSAVLSIHDYLLEQDLRSKAVIIADGGIKNPGHAVKYLCAGADAIMMGSVFSRCEESPGWEAVQQPLDASKPIVFPAKPTVKFFKSYRGQASEAFQVDVLGRRPACAEGASSPQFEWDGTYVQHVVDQYLGGVASAISYLGLRRMDDLKPNNVQFVEITAGGLLEGTAHGCNPKTS